MRLPPLIPAVPRAPGRVPGPGRGSDGIAAAQTVAATDPKPAKDGHLYSYWARSSKDAGELRQTFSCTDPKSWCPCVDPGNVGRYVCCPKPTDGTKSHCDCSAVVSGTVTPCTPVPVPP